MSLSGLLVHDITILRPGTVEDRYHNAAKDWAGATSTNVKGWISRTSSGEVNGEREAEVSGWIVYLPVGTDIVGGDRVTWNGTTFEVDGPPNHAWRPQGEHHIEAQLRVVQG